MPGRRKVGNLLALAVLAYLTQRPMHPYELSRTLRQHDDGRSIKFTHGSLYMVVGQLAKAGLVEPTETSREGQRPERTTYALTTAGRAEFADWLRELVEEPQHEYPHFVAALSLIGALRPDDAAELLRQRLIRLADLESELRELIDASLDGGVHPLFLVEEEYRLTIAAAESAFTRSLVERITDPATGWSQAWTAFHDSAPRPPETGSGQPPEDAP
jgi:DNA-binding PadR family transcriptional regulator